MQTILSINRDGSEKFSYNCADYPLYLHAAPLSSYPDYRAISHWHEDIELVYIFSGSMDYNVNGAVVRLCAGEGIFVNTRQLHYGFSDERGECQFFCVLFPAGILSPTAEFSHRFIAPVLQNAALPYLHLRHGDAEALRCLRAVYAERESDTFPLKAQQYLTAIWEYIYHAAQSSGAPPQQDYRLAALRDMLSFIEANYAGRITLADICRAGAVGKTGCCAIFTALANQTPMAYLNSYRLRQSERLLRQSAMTVAEIAFAVGFSGASYYAECFRRAYGCTPREYRAAAEI